MLNRFVAPPAEGRIHLEVDGIASGKRWSSLVPRVQGEALQKNLTRMKQPAIVGFRR